jgi:2,3-bisphosphoglycerate-independent phosphoglycerate mutase
MAAQEITDNLIRVLAEDSFDFVVCNFANGDMVGHTGDFEAAKRAVETIDDCLGRIKKAVEQSCSQCLITADHGNVEQMIDLKTRQRHTAHTSERVPLVYMGRNAEQLAPNGTLADIAPTLLALMRTEVPEEMTGRSLLIGSNQPSSSDADEIDET